MSDKLGAEAASVIRVIYGGSVNDNNCEELAGMEDIDGFLVGPRARAGGGGRMLDAFIRMAQLQAGSLDAESALQQACCVAEQRAAAARARGSGRRCCTQPPHALTRRVLHAAAWPQVGGASLKGASFIKICNASKVKNARVTA